MSSASNRVSMSELMRRSTVENDYLYIDAKTTMTKPDVVDASTFKKKVNDDDEVPVNGVIITSSSSVPGKPSNRVVYGVITRPVSVGNVNTYLPLCQSNVYYNDDDECCDGDGVETSVGDEAGRLKSSAEKEDCSKAGDDMPKSFVRCSEIPASCQPDDDPIFNVYECLDDFQSQQDDM